MKNITLLILFPLILLTVSCQNSNTDLNQYVNPFIGTGGHGHTYPGASAPFGMVQLSPDTRLDSWDGCSGYHYSDSIVYGFTHTHLSGTGVLDYGDILLMPTSGKSYFDNGKENDKKGYATVFSHKDEIASPGFYAVTLPEEQIKVKLTASERCGFHHYTFEKDEPHFVILDLQHRDKVLSSSLQLLNDSTIIGYRNSEAWATNQHLYFYMVFSPPFKDYNHNLRTRNKKISGKDIKTILDFGAAKEVKVKVGISAVDVEGAKKNLQQEIPHFDFEKTLTQTQQAWEKELNKITIKDSDKTNKTIFYSALYHAYLNPNLFSDVDKRYRGTDQKIHQLKQGNQYTIFSLWDTFRGTHPLFTLTQQQRTTDMINTMLHQFEQGGRLPVWELAGNETDCMIGYHSIPVIVDAYVKGIKGFDLNLALKAMLNSASTDMEGLPAYRKFGYIPTSYEGESVSRTLEYAYDDWCIALFAKMIGNEKVYQEFIQRGQNWKNLYDDNTRFMRARINADWFTPFDPKEVNFHYTEANAWQYNFFVPQDVNTMIKFMGGKARFAEFLDQLFTEDSKTTGRTQSDITGLIGQYAHGNEPSHHIAYLYSFAEKPWKTQQYVREIMETLYQNAPDGLSGNEDCGQMSAWYVLSSLGFYPITPGTDYYVFGSPVFEEASLHLENGKTFEIISKNNSKSNVYIQKVFLNGKPYHKAFIHHQDIMNGGTLTFEMGSEANQEWFTTFPERTIKDQSIVPVPYVKNGEAAFKGQQKIALACIDKEADIYVSMVNKKDSIGFKRYTQPIEVNQTTTFYFYAQRNGKKSNILNNTFTRVQDNISIKLENTYPSQYAAGGNDALINGIKGGNSFKTGNWQGYQGQDLMATIDISKKKKVKSITVGFIQDSRSWILMPEYVKVFVSKNGKKFKEVGTATHKVSPKNTDPIIERFTIPVNKRVRYIKVMAKSPGKLPEWHLGAGHQSWLFADEIEVNLE